MSSSAFCSHCIELNELPGKPTGHETEVVGVSSYVAKGSKRGTIVIATDIFGLGIPNPMIIADNYAKESGFTTIVPDLFKKDPISPSDFQLKKHTNDSDPKPAEENFANFGKWLERGHGVEDTYPTFKKVVEAQAKEGPVAVIGYCYGGKLSSFAAQDAIVKGAVINHPAMLEKGEASKIKTPILLITSETDPIFSEDVKNDWTDTLNKAGLLDSNSQTYSGAVHGHACRPDLTKPDIKHAYEDSFKNSVTFFNRVLA
ncbi:hypothetical protein K437DRAFT_226252 [Tilletiaria anomala UBC 951]|uniref:Dienelactone hydrolase domain-containing protein n=1 Tax=Tilletiaria anomala (strain ATCC 24038 / CBS 436.72 / UBC 951) TaxID=1037660 RepID=A0A066VLS9_TILAU|nr:uncharacterized protein K437DRAFT_226252 [Tilletiaria anomala UBC 951]KDN42416.1 hypothetical protein K437DRAFT_226252 [Tilletiaria anomala UBC 951]